MEGRLGRGRPHWCAGGGDPALSYATAHTDWRMAGNGKDLYYFPVFASRTGVEGLELVSGVSGEDQSEKGLSTMLVEAFFKRDGS